MTDVVSVLCNILNSLAKSELLKTEYFNVAKQNKADNNVITAFWKLLSIFSNNSDQTNLVRAVKLYFAGFNYKCLEFYNLPHDFTSGSKELLLALSWLIGEKHIIELLMWNVIEDSKINEEFSPFARQYPEELEFNVSEINSLEDYKKSVLLLTGKINSYIKQAAECNEKLSELLFKIHKETHDIINLSVGEMYCLKGSESLDAYVNEIKTISNLLFNYCKWKSKENYYWTWMLTVMKMKTDNTKKHTNTENLESFFNYLSCQVKILVKNKRENIRIVRNKYQMPRCIYFADTSRDTHVIISNNKSKGYLANEENNVENIYQYLYNFLYTDSQETV